MLTGWKLAEAMLWGDEGPMGDVRNLNVKSAPVVVAERAITGLDGAATRQRSARAMSTRADAWKGFLARMPWGSHETKWGAGSVVAGLRTAMTAAATWMMPEREPHAFRSAPPFHFDRVFRTWQ